MQNIYLNKSKKKYYMDDFHVLLNCELEFWKLDAGIKEILIQINSNENIQTLYSKKHGLNNFHDDDSYLRFCYKREIELQLFRFLLPDLILKFNCRPDTCIYYDFSFPKENINCNDDTHKLGLGCTDDKDYFQINHLSICLNSKDIEIHDEFWMDLKIKLSNLLPNKNGLQQRV
jgi:hypothetical protein